jgi:hypothetical protein
MKERELMNRMEKHVKINVGESLRFDKKTLDRKSDTRASASTFNNPMPDFLNARLFWKI